MKPETWVRFDNHGDRVLKKKRKEKPWSSDKQKNKYIIVILFTRKKLCFFQSGMKNVFSSNTST